LNKITAGEKVGADKILKLKTLTKERGSSELRWTNCQVVVLSN